MIALLEITYCKDTKISGQTQVSGIYRLLFQFMCKKYPPPPHPKEVEVKQYSVISSVRIHVQIQFEDRITRNR